MIKRSGCELKKYIPYFILWLLLRIGNNLTSIRIAAWTSNYIHVKEWDVITNPCRNYNTGLVKNSLKLAWISNYITQETVAVITYHWKRSQMVELYLTDSLYFYYIMSNFAMQKCRIIIKRDFATVNTRRGDSLYLFVNFSACESTGNSAQSHSYLAVVTSA